VLKENVGRGHAAPTPNKPGKGQEEEKEMRKENVL
jgi:hypothetical protein